MIVLNNIYLPEFEVFSSVVSNTSSETQQYFLYKNLWNDEMNINLSSACMHEKLVLNEWIY
jgi:hypothetical protein